MTTILVIAAHPDDEVYGPGATVHRLISEGYEAHVLVLTGTKGGTDNLENPQIFQTPEVVQAGGVAALSQYGNPQEAYAETKLRMFTA